jgi:hypothetical protein
MNGVAGFMNARATLLLLGAQKFGAARFGFPDPSPKEMRAMARKVQIDQAIADAEQILRVWADNADFTLGEITQPKLQKMVADLRATRGQTETLRTQLTASVNETNELGSDIAAIVTRARSGFRAVYGPNSTQYEQAGGTRTVDRKRPPARKKKTSA